MTLMTLIVFSYSWCVTRTAVLFVPGRAAKS
jgi:hypothetical protein